MVRNSNAALPPEGYHPNGAISGSTLSFLRPSRAHCEAVDRKWGMFRLMFGTPDFGWA